MSRTQLQPQPRGRTLLVVDDREANLVAMEALLGDGDWQVHTVNSGEAALQALLELDVELVLLDVQMPGMDGFEVARLMRGNPQTRYTPIIFVSAIAHTRDSVLEGYATGAVDFILKPFDPQVLKHKINTLLAHEHNRRDLQLLTQQLDSARAFNASVLNNAAEGILVVGEDGYINFANPAIAQMLGGTVDGLKGTPLLAHIAEPVFEQPWRESDFYLHWRSGATYRLHEAQLKKEGGGTLPVAISCSPLPRQQRSMVVIALDMSVVRNLHAQLETQAVTDSLTGLLNRRGFNQALESAVARADRNGKSMAVLYIDLDGFKRINDSLGHEAGDAILCKVARLLETCMRPYDILARMGGDEFTALLDSLDHTEDAAKVAEKLIELISVRHRIEDTEVTLGASIGIATFPECGDNVEELLRAADMAMYEAKRAGRQQFRFFSQEMNGRAHARLMMEENLRSAIEHNDFDLVYQRRCGSTAAACAASRRCCAGPERERPGAARRVRAAAGGNPADRAGRAVGAARRHRAVPRVAGAVRRWAGAQPQRQPGAVRPPGVGRHARPVDRRIPAVAVAAGAGTHRKRADDGPRPELRQAAQPARPGRAGGDRRLRHRLLVTGLPAQLRPRHPEDRPAVHRQHARLAARCRGGQHHHRPGTQSRPGGDRRGRGDHGPARLADRARLRRDAGLPGGAGAAGRAGQPLSLAAGLADFDRRS